MKKSWSLENIICGPSPDLVNVLVYSQSIANLEKNPYNNSISLYKPTYLLVFQYYQYHTKTYL